MNSITKDRCGYAGYECAKKTKLPEFIALEPEDIHAKPGSAKGTSKLAEYANYYNVPALMTGAMYALERINKINAVDPSIIPETSCQLHYDLPGEIAYYCTAPSGTIVGVTDYSISAKEPSQTTTYTYSGSSETNYIDLTETNKAFWPGYLEPLVTVPIKLPALDGIPAVDSALDGIIASLRGLTAWKDLSELSLKASHTKSGGRKKVRNKDIAEAIGGYGILCKVDGEKGKGKIIAQLVETGNFVMGGSTDKGVKDMPTPDPGMVYCDADRNLRGVDGSGIVKFEESIQYINYGAGYGQILKDDGGDITGVDTTTCDDE